MSQRVLGSLVFKNEEDAEIAFKIYQDGFVKYILTEDEDYKERKEVEKSEIFECYGNFYLDGSNINFRFEYDYHYWNATGGGYFNNESMPIHIRFHYVECGDFFSDIIEYSKEEKTMMVSPLSDLFKAI